MLSSELQNRSIATLRGILLALPPSGETGFEGLVATIVAAATGLQVRLARSGSQFGRDASSPTGPFSIAIEAKRYDSPLRLEDLLGKAALAIATLSADTDLWVVGATSEVGDDTVRKISKFVEEQGMSVLFLDWALRPIPPLAVLLGSRPETTEQWFTRFQPTVDRKQLRAALEAIGDLEGFSTAQVSLAASLSSAEVGLGSLRQRNDSWLRERWSDAPLSRQEFGQIITPLAPANHVLEGRSARLNLNSLILTDARRPVVAVLGEEGVGKTWLIADWWLSSATQSLFLPVLGKSIELLDAGDPIGSLARLLERFFGNGRVDAAGWERRLGRWSKRVDEGSPWLVVCFDGLNERPDLPWGNLVSTFGAELAKLGGSLLVTCRPAFWIRDVVPRLERSLACITIRLDEYLPSEVQDLLALNGIDPNALSERVRKFVQNPRICNVALNLLRELAAAPGELTTERLQFEYWKQRLTERGNFVQHDLAAFHETLKMHARKLGSDPNRRFPLYDWFENSPLGKRGLSTVERDTSDIVEGLFMRATESDPSTYQFRHDALPFAIGLRVAHELRDLSPGDAASFDQTIESLIEPVRAFGLTSEIIGAAFGLSLLDQTYPNEGQRALLKAWAALQNLDEEALEAMAANAQIGPNVFCDVLEELHRSGEYYPQERQLERFLFLCSADAHLRGAMAERMRSWLNRWSTRGVQFPGVKEKIEPRASVAENIALLTLSEREEFDAICSEVADPRAVRTDELATILLLSGPQAVYAKSIWAWCLAQTIASDYSCPQEDLQWAIRLNVADWKATTLAIRASVDAVTGQSSEPFRRAAGRALRLVGDIESEMIAETLTGPLQAGSSWRRVELFCNTNPHDPAAPVCDNLDNAILTLADILVDNLRTGRYSNADDHNFAVILPSLARFAPEPLIETVRRFVRSMETREGLPLLALSWELDEVSPTLDEATIAVVELSLKRFATEELDWNKGDNQLLVNRALYTIFPHVSVDKQLELLLSLPAGVRMFVNLFDTLKNASAEQLEAAFLTAAASSNASAIERVLFIVSASPVELTPYLRASIREQISWGSQTAKNIALDVIRRSADKELDSYLLQLAEDLPLDNSEAEEFYRTEATIGAVIRSGDADRLRLIPPNLVQAAAAQMGVEAIAFVTERVDAAVHCLLGPMPEGADLQFPIIVETTPNGLMQRVSVSPSDDLPIALIADPEVTANKFGESQQQRITDYQATTRRLSELGAEALLAVPSERCLARVIDRTPSRVASWLSCIATETDRHRLKQIFNLGTAMAAGFARIDGSLSAQVLRHLAGQRPLHRIISGDMNIPLYVQAIFAASESVEMDKLRQETIERAASDADLELYARAASVGGSHTWLTRYIHTHHLDEHPAVQARAIVLSGFCFIEDDLADIFGKERKTGFLGQVRQFALKQRQRAEWADHWCRAALHAKSGVDFWRFGKLAEAVVDGRFVRNFVSQTDDGRYAPFERELYLRLNKAAEERNKQRSKALFGLKVPSDRMQWAIETSRTR